MYNCIGRIIMYNPYFSSNSRNSWRKIFVSSIFVFVYNFKGNTILLRLILDQAVGTIIDLEPHLVTTIIVIVCSQLKHQKLFDLRLLKFLLQILYLLMYFSSYRLVQKTRIYMIGLTSSHVHDSFEGFRLSFFGIILRTDDVYEFLHHVI